MQDKILDFRSYIGGLTPPMDSPMLSPLNLSPFLTNSTPMKEKTGGRDFALDFEQGGGRKKRRVSEL